jgi:hypothetical protein
MVNFLSAHPWVIAVIFVWTIPWKGAALWRAARRAHAGWFIALLILNTMAILEILYLFVFSKLSSRKKTQVDDNDDNDNFTDNDRLASSGGKKMIIM